MKKKAKNKKQTKSHPKRITRSAVFNKEFLDGSISVKDCNSEFNSVLVLLGKGGRISPL